MEELTKQKNNAYWERNQLVSALSKVMPSFLAKHPDNEEWEDDWRTIVVIELPPDLSKKPLSVPTVWGDERNLRGAEPEPHAWQMSWHIHDSDVPMFDHLSYSRTFVWDGHTTEEKYRRLRTLKQSHLKAIKEQE